MTPYILDTDTLSLYQKGHLQVVHRWQAQPTSDRAITVISVDEQLSGWYTAVRKARRSDELAWAYESLADSVRSLSQVTILPFTTVAIARYEQLLRLRLNVRRMDLRIAAIVVEDGGTLVTRNTRDFSRVPGLVLEDWSI